nr:hypothetical protein [uncultured bacterium]
MKKLFRVLALLLIASHAQAATLTAFSCNLQHGQGTDLSFNFQRQIDSMAGADIIAVQERSTTETGWNTPLSNAGLTEAVFAADPGGGDGQALWIKNSTISVVQTYTHPLTNVANPTSGSTTFGWDGSTDVRRSAAAAKLSVGGLQFYAVSIHFCPSRCNDSSSVTTSAQRESQIDDLKNWISATLTGGLKILVLGDYNFAPNQPKIGGGVVFDLLTPTYTNLWDAAVTAGTATASWGDRNSDGIPDMPVSSSTSRTHDTRIIDGGLLSIASANTTWTLTNANIPDVRATCPHALVAGGALPSCSPEVDGGPGVSSEQWDIPEDFGVRPSDHNWITFTFTIVTTTSASTNRGHTHGVFKTRRGVIR